MENDFRLWFVYKYLKNVLYSSYNLFWVYKKAKSNIMKYMNNIYLAMRKLKKERVIKLVYLYII
jgi:hypothetical protein